MRCHRHREVHIEAKHVLWENITTWIGARHERRRRSHLRWNPELGEPVRFGTASSAHDASPNPIPGRLSEDDLIVLKAETRINRRLAFGADVFASAGRSVGGPQRRFGETVGCSGDAPLVADRRGPFNPRRPRCA